MSDFLYSPSGMPEPGLDKQRERDQQQRQIRNEAKRLQAERRVVAMGYRAAYRSKDANAAMDMLNKARELERSGSEGPEFGLGNFAGALDMAKINMANQQRLASRVNSGVAATQQQGFFKAPSGNAVPIVSNPSPAVGLSESNSSLPPFFQNQGFSGFQKVQPITIGQARPQQAAQTYGYADEKKSLFGQMLNYSLAGKDVNLLRGQAKDIGIDDEAWKRGLVSLGNAVQGARVRQAVADVGEYGLDSATGYTPGAGAMARTTNPGVPIAAGTPPPEYLETSRPGMINGQPAFRMLGEMRALSPQGKDATAISEYEKLKASLKDPKGTPESDKAAYQGIQELRKNNPHLASQFNRSAIGGATEKLANDKKLGGAHVRDKSFGGRVLKKNEEAEGLARVKQLIDSNASKQEILDAWGLKDEDLEGMTLLEAWQSHYHAMSPQGRNTLSKVLESQRSKSRGKANGK